MSDVGVDSVGSVLSDSVESLVSEEESVELVLSDEDSVEDSVEGSLEDSLEDPIEDSLEDPIEDSDDESVEAGEFSVVTSASLLELPTIVVSSDDCSAVVPPVSPLTDISVEISETPDTVVSPVTSPKFKIITLTTFKKFSQ